MKSIFFFWPACLRLALDHLDLLKLRIDSSSHRLSARNDKAGADELSDSGIGIAVGMISRFVGIIMCKPYTHDTSTSHP